MRARRVLLASALLLLGAGGVLLARRAGLEAKAILARHLIARAFAGHLRDGRPHRPWSWADTHPIALLTIERLDVRRIVLAGASGTSMAFGVGHIDGTSRPNGPGNCVLAGHRDRELAFLERLRRGDVLRLRTANALRDYIVDGIAVVPRADAWVLGRTVEDRLTLLTCYPFRGLSRSPWRYVVTAAAATRDRSPITETSSPGGGSGCGPW